MCEDFRRNYNQKKKRSFSQAFKKVCFLKDYWRIGQLPDSVDGFVKGAMSFVLFVYS